MDTEFNQILAKYSPTQEELEDFESFCTSWGFDGRLVDIKVEINGLKETAWEIWKVSSEDRIQGYYSIEATRDLYESEDFKYPSQPKVLTEKEIKEMMRE